MDGLSGDQWKPGAGLLESVWRHRWIVVVAVLLAGTAGYLRADRQPDAYEASARVFLIDPRTAELVREERGTANLDVARYLRTRAQIMTSAPVAERASELLSGALAPEEIREVVVARPAFDHDAVAVRTTHADPELAAAVPNAVVDAYTDVVAAEAQTDSDGSGVEVIEKASVPSVPSYPQPWRDAMIAAILGLLGATALGFWQAGRRQATERRASNAARILGAPLLGQVPDFRRAGVKGPIPTATAPGSSVAEAYGFVVASLEFALANTGGSTVLVTSPGPGDGKTATVLNLAVSAGYDGRRVIAVDGDLRSSSLSRLCGCYDAVGLTNLTADGVTVDWCAGQCAPPDCPQPKPRVISAGTPVKDPAGFFRSPAFPKAMVRIREHADLALIDSPPLLSVSDALAMTPHVDGVVLVIEPQTPKRILREVREQLDRWQKSLLGYVINGAKPARDRYHDSHPSDAGPVGAATDFAGSNRTWRGRSRPVGTNA